MKLTIQTELESFHAAHFSNTSSNHFAQHFLGPIDGDHFDETDDGLGYYDDGVKRTLTDAQIAIFRHSEIQAILRDRRYAEEAKSNNDDISGSKVEECEFEPGELEDDSLPNHYASYTPAGSEETYTPPSTSDRPSKASLKNGKKAKKAEKARQKGWFKQNVKPDLRKRTWDKVDTGVGNLDYDEDIGRSQAQNPPSQRRRICYDD